MKTNLIMPFRIVALLLFGALLTSCDNQRKEKPVITDTVKRDSLATDTSILPTSSWVYEARNDAMTSDTIYYAQTIAQNLLQFKPPYDGGATCYLTIRNKDGVNKAYIEVEKGQFLINTYSAKLWKIRVDTNKFDYYLFNPASSGNSKIAFVNRSADFIKSLKNHKRLLIEAEFYQDGLRQIEYNIEGFVWKH